MDISDARSANPVLPGRNRLELPSNVKFKNLRQPLKHKPEKPATDDAAQIA
jgi:hypothetical protein